MAFVLDRQGAHDILCSKNATRKGIKRHKVNQKQFNQSLQQELCLEPCRNQDPWSQLSDDELNDKVYRDEKGFDVLLRKKQRNLNERHKKSLKTEVELKGIQKKIDVPLSGSSYNPSEEDRIAALDKALDLSNRQYKFDMEYKDKLEQSRKLQLEESLKPEAQEDDQDVEESTEGDSSKPYVALNKVVKAQDRKTQAQRNKDRRLRERLHQLSVQRQEKMKIKDINKMSMILKDLADHKLAKSAAKARLLQIRNSFSAADWAERIRIGRNRYTPSVPDIPFAEDISGGSLRSLKPRGDILHDQWQNLQKFGILEPLSRSSRIQVRNSSYKFIASNSWKDQPQQHTQ